MARMLSHFTITEAGEDYLLSIEDDAGFNAGAMRCRIEFDDGVHVLREVDDDGNIAGLACDTGAAAPGEDGGSIRECQ